MKKIAIFASGSGSNAEKIMQYFAKNKTASVELILSNNPQAYVLKRAENQEIKSIIFDKKTFYQSDKITKLLQQKKIDLLVLAGFLWLIPDNLLKHFPEKIINIHPALLPAYGGKGMYGARVHQAVIAAKEKQSGISIHYVNSKYDEGKIIFQAKCPVAPNDTAEMLASKVLQLEHRYFPLVIEKLAKQLS